MTNLIGSDLKDKHVVIVGGGSGMGKATAELAAYFGARVTIASRDADKLTKVAAAIEGDVSVAPVDTTNEAAVRTWAAALGAVDHLVISASSAAHGTYADLPTGELRAMFEAKFIGPYVTAREVLPHLNPSASITFFSGVLSRRPSAGATGLSAVNAAVETLTKGLAQEIAEQARVNCISPGMVATEAYAAMPEAARTEMYAQVGDALPVGRVGEAAEIAQAVIFAMTNPFLTGSVIDVDGGHLVRA